jgi:hypothetical protein
MEHPVEIPPIILSRPRLAPALRRQQNPDHGIHPPSAVFRNLTGSPKLIGF